MSEIDKELALIAYVKAVCKIKRRLMNQLTFVEGLLWWLIVALLGGLNVMGRLASPMIDKVLSGCILLGGAVFYLVGFPLYCRVKRKLSRLDPAMGMPLVRSGR